MIQGYAKKKAGGRVKPLSRDAAGNVSVTVTVFDEDGVKTDRGAGAFNGVQLRAIIADKKEALKRMRAAQKDALDLLTAEIADTEALERDVSEFEAAEAAKALPAPSGAPDKIK